MDLAETLVLLVVGLWILRRARPGALRWPVGVALLTLAHALLMDSRITPLTISEVSLWIDLHAALAWLAWAFLFLALGLAFRQDEADQALALRLLGYGFFAQTAMGMVGAYYGTLIWATGWSWDPVQTLGLMSWLLIGMAVHFRLFFGVSLYRQRWFLAVCLLAFVLAAKLIMFLPQGQSFHVFELGAMLPEGP